MPCRLRAPRKASWRENEARPHYKIDSGGCVVLDRGPKESPMAVSRMTMTDEQRKSVALEYL